MNMHVTTHTEALRTRVNNHFNARLPDHLDRLAWDSDQIATWQEHHLRALLAHAVARSPFHAARLAGVDPHRCTLGDLSRLPVMTKSEMMAGLDGVMTDRRLTRRVIEDHMVAAAREPRLLLDEYVCLASGGSSGERGIFVYTLQEFVELTAAVLRSGMARVLAAGGPPPGGLVVGLVAAASPVHPTGLAAALGRLGAARMVPVPATLPLPEIVDRLNALQPDLLIGYGLQIVRLATEQRAGRLAIAPQSVVTTSELLTGEDRLAIKAAFGAPVMDSFGSTEGLIGSSGPNDAVHVRATVEGRADELLTFGSVTVHPHAIRTVMVKTPVVTEPRVNQTPGGIDVEAVVSADRRVRVERRAPRRPEPGRACRSSGDGPGRGQHRASQGRGQGPLRGPSVASRGAPEATLPSAPAPYEL